jgi:hypothetical protein
MRRGKGLSMPAPNPQPVTTAHFKGALNQQHSVKARQKLWTNYKNYPYMASSSIRKPNTPVEHTAFFDHHKANWGRSLRSRFTIPNASF